MVFLANSWSSRKRKVTSIWLFLHPPLLMHSCWGIHGIEQAQSRPHWPFSLYLHHLYVRQLLTTSFSKCCEPSLTPHTSCQAQVPVGLGCQTFSESINAVAAVLPTLGGTPLPAAAHLPSPSTLNPGCWTGRQVSGQRLSWPSSFPVGDAKNELVSLDIVSFPPSSFSLFSQYHSISVF